MTITNKLSADKKTLEINITGQFNHSNAHDFIEACKKGLPDVYAIKINDEINALDDSAIEALNDLHHNAGMAEIHITCNTNIENVLKTQKVTWPNKIIVTDKKPVASFFKPLKSQP